MRPSRERLWVVLLLATASLASAAAPARASGTAAGPTISVQPANQTVNAGQTATFLVTATGTGTLTYQWKKGGTNVVGGSGATTASYTTPATAAADNGAKFTVDVTDSTGTTTSQQATLTVNSPPAITTQPTSQSIVEGQTATFTVVATGNSLGYQWRLNGTTIAGATASSFTTAAAVLGDSGKKYDVVVTNTAGNVTSQQATLTVGAATAVSITTQPANKTIVVGQTATFSVVVAGSTPITYQWKVNNTVIPGATASSYTTPVAAIGNNGDSYLVVVTNVKATVTSQAATLFVNAATAPSITTQPADQSAFVGQTATFTVVAAGSTPLTYQWQMNGANVGTNAASFTTAALALTDNNAKITVKVTNAAGNVTSRQATLTVSPVPPPTITTQPASISVVAGQTATFTVAATGVGTLTYQWRLNGATIAGATGTSYTTPATVLADNGKKYDVVVSNSAGPTTSQQVTLTVTPLTAPTITVQPQNRTVIAGFPATFTVTATSTVAITYQWFKNGTAVAGATGASYTTPATTLANNGDIYTVQVSNSVGPTLSSPATLTVETAATSIPGPWLDADVGAPAMPGDAVLNGTEFTVCGSGANIGGTADAFNFLYQRLSGDGSVAALVLPGSTTELAKVGVMVRETLDGGAAMAGVFVTGKDGTVFVHRNTTSAAAAQVAGTPTTVPVPYWVKIDRTGDLFTASISPDGTNWTVLGTATIPMPGGALIGFAVTAGDNAQLHCATIQTWIGTGGWVPNLRTQGGGGGGGGGGCGLLGLEGAALALLLRMVRARGRVWSGR